MITWEHLRFLALLIPTWLLLGAMAVSLAVPAKGRAAADDSLIQAAPATCKPSAGLATQQRKGQLVAAAERYREYPSAAAEE